jgi:arginase
VGTWSGVHAAMQSRRAGSELGLIWVDAHLDAHTVETSETSMPHGMPLAALLGHGDRSLTSVLGAAPKLLPRNVVLIGPRSWERGEHELLQRLGVRVIDGEEVLARGFEPCLHEAIRRVSEHTDGWGMSFDLDALDPVDVPGTGTPVERGIRLAEASAALHGVCVEPSFVAAELVEYNPALDVDRITAAAAECILAAMVDRRDPAQFRPCRIERRGAHAPAAETWRP